MCAAIYARVSTLDQEPENQLAEIRRYVAARGWTAVESVDAKEIDLKDPLENMGAQMAREVASKTQAPRPVRGCDHGGSLVQKLEDLVPLAGKVYRSDSTLS